MKKILTLVLALTVVLMAACSNSDNTSTKVTNGSKETEVKEEVVKLSMSAPDNTFGLCPDSDLQEAVVKMLEEKTGTDITSIIPPSC